MAFKSKVRERKREGGRESSSRDIGKCCLIIVAPDNLWGARPQKVCKSILRLQSADNQANYTQNEPQRFWLMRRRPGHVKRCQQSIGQQIDHPHTPNTLNIWISLSLSVSVSMCVCVCVCVCVVAAKWKLDWINNKLKHVSARWAQSNKTWQHFRFYLGQKFCGSRVDKQHFDLRG